jgi:hypothetical protein
MALQDLRRTTPSAANSTPQDLHTPRESTPSGQASSVVGKRPGNSPKKPAGVGHEKPTREAAYLALPSLARIPKPLTKGRLLRTMSICFSASKTSKAI